MVKTLARAAGREAWSTQLGFLLAAIGSAIGLGNIWRFPGIAYTNGGGAFIVPYLVALLTAGVPFLILDYSLGHRYKGSAPAVFKRLGRWWESLGWVQVAICFVILTYYAVILGWAVSYLGFSITKAWENNPDGPVGFFVADYLHLSDPELNFHGVPTVMYPLIAIWVVVLVILGLGVQRGLERANKVFIPLLAIVFLALVIRSLFLPGAAQGLDTLFSPNWSALTHVDVWIAAYSQIFFSLSVGFGIMLTYASYLKPRSNLSGTAAVAAFANSSFEILAGIGVFATLGYMAQASGQTVAEFGAENAITGVGLSFMTFPQIISTMPGGSLFGVVFFLSLVVAGMTSLLSLLQVVSAAVQEKFGLSTGRAATVVGAVAMLFSVGLFGTRNGLNALDVVDKVTNEIGIVGIAAVATIYVSFGVRKLEELRRHVNYNSTLFVGRWWNALVGVVVPLVLAYMLVITAIDLARNGYGGYPDGFVAAFGLGAIGFIVVLSALLPALPWRTAVTPFTPVPSMSALEPFADSAINPNLRGGPSHTPAPLSTVKEK